PAEVHRVAPLALDASGSGRPLDGEKFASEGGLEGAQRRDWCASCASCSPGGCHIASRSGERVTIRLAEVVTGLASRAGTTLRQPPPQRPLADAHSAGCPPDLLRRQVAGSLGVAQMRHQEPSLVDGPAG